MINVRTVPWVRTQQRCLNFVLNEYMHGKYRNPHAMLAGDVVSG